MINRKLNQIILALLIIGALVTFWTGEAVRDLREQQAPAETAPAETTPLPEPPAPTPETPVSDALGESLMAE